MLSHAGCTEHAVEHYEQRYFNIYELRNKWAARFTSSVFTHGASSTQRGESIFGVIKTKILGGIALVSLYEQLHALIDRKQAANIEAVTRMALRQQQFLTQSPLIKSLLNAGCSPYLVNLAAFQMSRACMYVHRSKTVDGQEVWDVIYHGALTEESGDDEGGGGNCTNMELGAVPEVDMQGEYVMHTCDYYTCTCQFPTKYGIFCAHMARVYFACNVMSVPDGVVSPTWLPHHSAPESNAAAFRSAGVPYDHLRATIPAGKTTFEAPTSLPGPCVRYQECLDLGRFLAKASESSPAVYNRVLPMLQAAAAPLLHRDASTSDAPAPAPAPDGDTLPRPPVADPQDGTHRPRRAKRKRAAYEAPPRRANGGQSKGRAKGKGKGKRAVPTRSGTRSQTQLPPIPLPMPPTPIVYATPIASVWNAQTRSWQR